jgi:hypothetical protein
MDGDLKCNRLVCRKALSDKAVVVSPSISAILARKLINSAAQTTCRFKHLSHCHFHCILPSFRFSYLLRYVTYQNVVIQQQTRPRFLVDCANELFNASRLCPGQ